MSIGDSVFEYCSNLAMIIIPDGVTSIGISAFYCCVSLKIIHFTGMIAQWKSISFGADWNLSTAAYTVTCADGTVSK